MKRSMKSAALLALASLTATSAQAWGWQDGIYSLGDRTTLTGGSTSRGGVPVLSIGRQDPDEASRLNVPAAPSVDQSADQAARPLTVPSNAATMPDDFYRSS